MIIRRIQKVGDGRGVLIPRDILNKAEWRGALHVVMSWNPPRLVVTPIRPEDLEAMEGYADHAIPKP